MKSQQLSLNTLFFCLFFLISMLGRLDSKLIKSNSDSSNFLANKLTNKPNFSSDSQERIYEVQVQLPQLGHELLSGDDFRNQKVMKKH